MVILIIWLHFIADFICQPRYIADNKNKYLHILAVHATIYSIFFIFWGPYVYLLILLSHFFIDFVSSKFTHYFMTKKQFYWFFTTIGIDQAVHLTSILLFIKYLGN